MRYSEDTSALRVQLDVHGGGVSPGEFEKMKASLDSLQKAVEKFPISDLHISVEHNERNNEYVVKTSLMLTGDTLVTSEHAPQAFTAFEQCVNVLLDQVMGYKDRLGGVPERQKLEKGTHQVVEPTVDPDPNALNAATEAGDYNAFRQATFGYEDSVNRRVGRWLERNPDMDSQVGRTLQIGDIVEEVFLMAFDRYGRRSRGIRFGDWLESLIDPAVKQLLAHPDEELENVNMARTARAAEAGPDAV
jgi:ribosome-associated translation inhibitor RaiA